MNAKEWAEFAKNVAETLAILGGGAGYFFYRYLRGSFTHNLSLSLECLRTKIANTEKDCLAVTAKLSKGDRYMIQLRDAQVRVNRVKWQESVPATECIATERLIGVDRRSYVPDGVDEKDRHDKPFRVCQEKIDFDHRAGSPGFQKEEGKDESILFLHLAPGDQTQFSQYFEVPSNSVCTVDVVVLAKRWYHPRLRWLRAAKKVGQWRASAVSAPLAKPAA